MKSLGIRVVGEEINLSIADKENEKIILEKIILPPLFHFPKKLKYLRFNLIDIFSEYSISYVSIKTIEYNAKSIDVKRCFIEGVIQEALATSEIQKYTIENLKGLAKKLNLTTKEYKNLLKNQEYFIKYINEKSFIVDKTNETKREAVLLSLSNILENK